MRTTPSRPLVRQNRIVWLLDRLEREPRADAVIEALRKGIRRLPLGDRRDLLHGRWLGHPVHPLMVQVPVGSWLSAAVLDLYPGRSRGAGVLVGVGLASAAPAALTGWVDWADLHREQQRVGLVHALANSAAVGLYAASLTCRVRGRRAAGRAYGFLGLTAVAAGGLLGGHLAYRQASGANHAEEVPHVVTEGWHRVGPMADFPVGEPVRRSVNDLPVLIVRESGGAVHALAERCSHLAGPLAEGTVSDGCVRCPWHGSVFRLSDGWNVRGPATAPQPAFDTRVTDDGQVEIRLRRPHSNGQASHGRHARPAARSGHGRP
ncbi:Rieske (2Fe-2S) protein [Streptomyces thermoviolaceus]|uniref:Rieske (2Fe-2S) protein n=1 Tax=Streptomyces thermoviolaceus TaxID=1952 RepID=UPI001672FA0D|nr:Rieske (2Fe-2S) protein [Streptomyces thermoviolaceus]WTD46341.1 Rieske (2Fe-2S) protein [Streptomyces thermoviolaceus]